MTRSTPRSGHIAQNPEATPNRRDHLTDAKLARQYVRAIDAGHDELAATLAAILDERAERDAVAERARLENAEALHTSARFYAERGLPVFPLWPEAKTPLTANGFKDASTDPVQVDEWWTRQPQANIGAPTGVLFDAVDIDGAEGHLAITEHGVQFPVILGRQRTLKPGGWHYLVPVTGGGNRASMLPSVDYRGAGGYIVLAPSRVAGRRYRWIDVPEFLLPAGGAA